jgi:DNA polymerase III subunit gamma/tau
MNIDVNQFSLKYRPLYFKDVYGQDSTVKALLKRSKENDFPQAVCFRGKFGTGKSTLALILAACMQAHDENGEPIWDTPDNQAILNQTFDRDVLLLDASRWSGKDAMVEFTQSIATRPMYSASGIRVCIIEEADQASNAAMLSLLKILESSKPYNKFILCSMEDKGVPPAVLSRCQTYQIKSLSVKDTMLGLKHVMEESGNWNNPNIPDEFRLQGLSTIANASQGSMRQAVQYLEQCLFNEAWTVEKIDELLDVVDEEKTWQILEGLLQKSKDEKLWKTLLKLKTGDETSHFANYCIMLLSEAMVVKNTGVVYSESNRWSLEKLAKYPTLESLFNVFSLHPLLTKAYIRGSDILGALMDYYNGYPKKEVVTVAPVKEEPKVVEVKKEEPAIRMRQKPIKSAIGSVNIVF